MLSSIRKASPPVPRTGDEANWKDATINPWCPECSLQLWSSGFKRRLGKGPGESGNDIQSTNWLPYLEQIASMNLQPGREARKRKSFDGVCKIPNGLEKADLDSLSAPVQKSRGHRGKLGVGRLNQDAPSHTVTAAERGATGVSGCQKFVCIPKKSV